jgi:hypothetical protein
MSSLKTNTLKGLQSYLEAVFQSLLALHLHINPIILNIVSVSSILGFPN